MILKKTVKTGLWLSGACIALATTGCSSVIQTPADQLLAEQYVVPTSKPGTHVDGIPASDDIAAMAAMETEVALAKERAAQKAALDRAAAAAAAAAAQQMPQPGADPVTQAAQANGPTVELASAVNEPAQTLAYAPPLPSESDAMAAQTAAMQGQQIEPGQAPVQQASLTIASDPGVAPGQISTLISKYALMYGVPESLVHRVAKRESTYNPRALHRGNYGLMQIRYNTARSLGYDGNPSGLLDAETNLKYAVKYLRGAWLVAGKNEKAADWLYRTGYYYDAKRKGLLDQIQ